MFQNYLNIALRNLVKHRLNSFINIGGLTVGFACAIFIALFVRDELSYDRWIPGTENLYRVETTFNNPGQPPLRTSLAPFPIPEAMLQKIPEVRGMSRVIAERMTVIVENRQFPERVVVVDPNFFQLIKLPLLHGSAARVFEQPESVVLSESAAKKYFGSESPLGRTITLSGQNCDAKGQNCQTREHSLVVTGVMRNLPPNTQLRADILIPNTSAADQMSQFEKSNWLEIVGFGYIALNPGADPAAVIAKLKTIIDQSVDLKKVLNLNMRGSAYLTPYLARFVDDHLSTDKYGYMVSPGSWTTVYGFSAIGVLILLLGSFNFTNLATAMATVREREISLRKVVGATRRQLIVQFLTESILIALISLILAFALVEVLLPAFNGFLNKSIKINYFADWKFISASIVIAILVGFLSGIYPALILSGFRPAMTLRTSSANQFGSTLLRTSLVVLQFAVSIGLGIAALVVFAQISYARNIDLGFRRNGIIVVDARSLSPSAERGFVDTLRANPRIADAAISNAIPLDGHVFYADVRVPDGHSAETFRMLSVSPGYLHLYGIHLLGGRVLSEAYGEDTHLAGKPYNVLINSAAARRLGYSVADAIGKTFIVHTTPVTIVGVIADTKIAGPKKQIAGTVYRYDPNFSPYVSIRVGASDLASTVSIIDKTWRQFAPTVAIQRHFLNDDFENQFQSDERQGRVFDVFVCIAVFIACLGLFGLSSFTATRRTKEIGVRKAFGARVYDIISLLLLQFSFPVLMANLIAWPFAWYYLHDWLQGYAYRIPLSPIYFIAASAAALVVAWATVFAHALHVANRNPVDALRYE